MFIYIHYIYICKFIYLSIYILYIFVYIYYIYYIHQHINDLADGLSSNAKLFVDDTLLFSVAHDEDTLHIY